MSVAQPPTPKTFETVRLPARCDLAILFAVRTRLAKQCIGAAIVAALAFALTSAAHAQDEMRGVDLSSPEMTTAEMTRAEVEAVLAAAAGRGADFSGKRLSGLDLSGLDFSGANLRAARLNRSNLSRAKLDGARLDQAWALQVDLTGASLIKASLFATQMAGARLDGANLAEARIAANMNRAGLVGARLEKADCGVDLKNQSMGLIRASFKSADLTGADFAGANLTLADLQFAKMQSSDLSGAVLREADASGADLRGARLEGADATGLDIRFPRALTAVRCPFSPKLSTSTGLFATRAEPPARLCPPRGQRAPPARRGRRHIPMLNERSWIVERGA